jgi:hypothetical protein
MAVMFGGKIDDGDCHEDEDEALLATGSGISWYTCS